MDRLLMERSLIERELDCSQHDPIEVVLIFDKSNATPDGKTQLQKKKKRKRKRPSKSHSTYSSPKGRKRPKRNKGQKGPFTYDALQLVGERVPKKRTLVLIGCVIVTLTKGGPKNAKILWTSHVNGP